MLQAGAWQRRACSNANTTEWFAGGRAALSPVDGGCRTPQAGKWSLGRPGGQKMTAPFERLLPLRDRGDTRYPRGESAMDMAEEARIARELVVLRYGADGWSCSKCGGTSSYQLRGRPKVFQCADRTCKRQQSVLAGTAFQATRLPLQKIVQAVDLFCRRRGVSSRALAKWLGVSLRAAWQLLHRIRSVLTVEDAPLEGRVAIGSVFRVFAPPRRVVATGTVLAVDENGRLRAELGSRDQLEAALQPEVQVAKWPGDRPEPVAALLAAASGLLNLRLTFTYRRVSHLWIGRYLEAFRFLWQGFKATRPGGPTIAETHVQLVQAVLARCVGRPRRTFAELRPEWPVRDPPPIPVWRWAYLIRRLSRHHERGRARLGSRA